METKLTSENPALLNQMAAKATETAEEIITVIADIVPPTDNLVYLPGGYVTPAGEVIKTAEVRELTGRDEEVISKIGNLVRALPTILERAVVKIGDEPATTAILDQMLSGDRDALMLGIYKATFGPTATLPAVCNGCDEVKLVEIDIDRDIEVATLTNPVADKEFIVKGKHEYSVILPTGITYKEIAENSDKTMSELTTILLEQTVTEIDGVVVLSKNQVRDIGIADRRKIALEINTRNPGPKFEEAVVDCPDCGGKVVVPVNLGALFRF